MERDFWNEGYQAGKAGKVYADNPHEGSEPAATAWAFGCCEGTKARNKAAFRSLLAEMRA